jgi:hypothetical protein
VNDAQLRLVQANLSEARQSAMRSVLKKQLSIPFVSWVVERVNLPVIAANSKYTQLFDIHRNCRQVIMMIPESGQSDPLKSFEDNQSQYRFSLDTHYTSGRYIKPYDSLYFDRLIRGFANSGQVINDLIGPDTNRMLWCQDIPVDGALHQLQIEALQNGTAGTANRILYVFQCVNKVIQNKGGQMSIQ